MYILKFETETQSYLVTLTTSKIDIVRVVSYGDNLGKP
jgi:hypothetical protein